MVVADPTAELINLVRAMADPAPAEAPPAARRQANLVRRRFGLALPTPFVGPPGAEEPVRVATAADGPAIAAVKWRVFGSSYRGILPDEFLDSRDVVPPASFWIGRGMVPPSRFHRLFVWGRPGTVHGYLDCGPAHPADAAADAAFDADLAREAGDGSRRSESDAAPAARSRTITGTIALSVADVADVADVAHEPREEKVGEVWELYVDPAARERRGGARLLAAAEDWLDGVGLHHQVLSVMDANTAAQDFYRSQGWGPTGRTVEVDLGVVAFEELRFRRGHPHVSSG